RMLFHSRPGVTACVGDVEDEETVEERLFARAFWIVVQDLSSTGSRLESIVAYDSGSQRCSTTKQEEDEKELRLEKTMGCGIDFSALCLVSVVGSMLSISVSQNENLAQRSGSSDNNDGE